MSGSRPAPDSAPAGGVGPAGASVSTGRRQLTVAVLGCLAGAGLAFLAGNRTWAVRVTPRQPPLSPLRESFSGGDLAPWLPAAALVALAAAVAFLATRGRGRLAVAVVAAVCGVAILAGAGSGLAASYGGGRTSVAGGLWPVGCGVGGLAVLGAAVLTAYRGRDWPSMGSRYQRPAAAPESVRRPDDTAGLWDALDSGTDPTEPRP